jgi:hypothetical protein
MLASLPASMLNQNHSDLGIPNRFKLDPSRSSASAARLTFTMAPQELVAKPSHQFFNSAPPARSTIEVTRLPKDASVEVEAIALRLK